MPSRKKVPDGGSLSAAESIAAVGLDARRQLIQVDYQTLGREVERRLGLPEGAIGRTHAIDLAGMRVVRIPQPPPPLKVPDAAKLANGPTEQLPD